MRVSGRIRSHILLNLLLLNRLPRVSIEGNVYEMYFFGYGNFVSTAGDVGVTLTKYLAVKAGHPLGFGLKVKALPIELPRI